MSKVKYFDNAATTRLDEDLLPILKKYNVDNFYNPSALNRFSTQVALDIQKARERIANLIGAESREITFTSCGTEADNTAMFGALRGYRGNIVTSAAEHPAVYSAANFLKSKGVEVRYINLHNDGRANKESLSQLIDENTQYVSLMHVNNESGAINDIKTLCETTKKINPNCLFICDGVQAYGKIQVNVKNLNVDYYTASGHKINAPKGIGILCARNNVRFNPLIMGGGQESGLRSGTENIANIMAFARASQTIFDSMSNSSLKYNNIKNTMLEIVYENCNEFYVLAENDNCSPAILTLMFKDIKTEVLLHMVETEDFVFGTGSACSSSNKTGRVISALNVPNDYREGMVRISFDKYSTKEDAIEFALCLCKNVNNLRKTIRG